ncbi:class I SAM-dependent methyltransferase [Nonomuraea jiangxiensis]|uniref:Ubiquinone/menaquinone biosynthesis C-methylase UbiE n=1 Tax=Nonomuraea jiangxiensis TaxID=633440 RepID=A0A1G9N915_9ACTN|nr:class I SAM-dependent methyltransferase [Nonomuraea jiangxiensis]SDL82934.1 Ubiquinone/menaquinone biosynthesis C-methylase UbiE [Nonomuraea jiangxiensis]
MPDDRAAAVVDRCTEAAATWLPLAGPIEAQLAPLNDVLFPAAGLRPGESVIDVGCGTGDTTRRAASLVGGTGQVLGIDAARNAIEHARHHPAGTHDPDTAPITWAVADAQRHAFPAAAADAVISRLGVMFFDEPVEAFANLAAATRPGGRFCAVVWTFRDESPFLQLNLTVAVETAASYGWTLDAGPPDAAPFGFATDETLGILAKAAWEDPGLRRHRVPLYARGPGTPPETIADEFVASGPLASQLQGAPPEVVEAVRRAVREELTTCWDGRGVRLDASVAVLTATRA